MRRLNVRQGVIGGWVVSVVCAAGMAGRSADPLWTFLSVLAFALSCVALVSLLVVAIARSSKPPISW